MLHYFGVTFAVTDRLQEQQSILASATHWLGLYRAGHLSRTVLGTCVVAVMPSLKSLFSLHFYILPICFHLWFYILCYHTVRFCNKMQVRLRRIILCAFEFEKTCGFRVRNTIDHRVCPGWLRGVYAGAPSYLSSCKISAKSNNPQPSCTDITKDGRGPPSRVFEESVFEPFRTFRGPILYLHIKFDVLHDSC